MMAIRIRRKKGIYKALCAAKSEHEKGDVYLNDGMHTALSDKFYNDFKQMEFIKKEMVEKEKKVDTINEYTSNKPIYWHPSQTIIKDSELKTPPSE